MPTSNATLFYQGNNESQLNGRQLTVPSGGTLGGGSSINLMMYSRAQRVDFDSWKTPGWTTDDMIPYLKKVSTSTASVEFEDLAANRAAFSGSGTFYITHFVFTITMIGNKDECAIRNCHSEHPLKKLSNNCPA